MPRFFFHIRENGELDEDDQGVEFESLDQAYEEAVRAALEMRLEKSRHCGEVDQRIFEITAPDGLVLRELAFKNLLDC